MCSSSHDSSRVVPSPWWTRPPRSWPYLTTLMVAVVGRDAGGGDVGADEGVDERRLAARELAHHGDQQRLLQLGGGARDLADQVPEIGAGGEGALEGGGAGQERGLVVGRAGGDAELIGAGLAQHLAGTGVVGREGERGAGRRGPPPPHRSSRDRGRGPGGPPRSTPRPPAGAERSTASAASSWPLSRSSAARAASAIGEPGSWASEIVGPAHGAGAIAGGVGDLDGVAQRARSRRRGRARARRPPRRWADRRARGPAPPGGRGWRRGAAPARAPRGSAGGRWRDRAARRRRRRARSARRSASRLASGPCDARAAARARSNNAPAAWTRLSSRARRPSAARRGGWCRLGVGGALEMAAGLGRGGALVAQERQAELGAGVGVVGRLGDRLAQLADRLVELALRPPRPAEREVRRRQEAAFAAGLVDAAGEVRHRLAGAIERHQRLPEADQGVGIVGPLGERALEGARPPPASDPAPGGRRRGGSRPGRDRRDRRATPPAPRPRRRDRRRRAGCGPG